MIATVGAMDDATFQRWHAQKLTEFVEPPSMPRIAARHFTHRPADR
ncbi:MAG: hypothetical protein ACJ8H8_19485 [Geminicoccaceae bacterium]